MHTLTLVFAGLSTSFAIWATGPKLPDKRRQYASKQLLDIDTKWKVLLAAVFGLLAFLSLVWTQVFG
jgi:hypothetical protein